MKRAYPRAVTLIELLVVADIVAVLASVLVPISSKALAKAQQTSCSSNLKRFGLAFQMYADDYGRRLPNPGGGASFNDVWDQNNGSTINAYVSHGPRLQADPAGIWACPAYEARGLVAKQQNAVGGYASRSYGMNQYLRSTPDLEYPACNSVDGGIAITTIKTPNDTILLYEGCYRLTDGYVSRTGGMTAVYGYARTAAEQTDYNGYSYGVGWHDGRNNYLWCDGHVSAMAPETRADYPTGAPGYSSQGKNHWYALKHRDS